MRYIALLPLLFAIPFLSADWKEKTYRGANCGPHLTEQDVADFADYGGNLLRVAFPTLLFRYLEAPYDFNEEAFTELDRILALGEKYDVDILIDPHRYPGMIFPWTTFASDEFWKDFKYHDLFIETWTEIATRFGSKYDSIAGYDLINEPALLRGGNIGQARDLNLLYQKTVAAIREIDPDTYIVLASPRLRYGDQVVSYNNGIFYLQLPDDPNLVVETHMYTPQSLTHQDFWDREGKLIDYPGVIDGRLWNADTVAENFQEVIEFQKKTGVPIFIGEFSVTRWRGESGDQYVKDVIDLAEAHGFHWAYHAYRESPIWDPEMSNTDKSDESRSPNAPRIELLKSYWQQNK
ncbi:glycoside hydrolase family 5 protein [Pelagicoccus mobilis]|uniref:Cellulase family glycosylhydrolase n=1 Tax=Pelagicoccus mobilis TaxID=415221 RepID=A0A934RXS6_9BACT|nr:cellulase family glycosylhydrolase [Pelagicoccus mobilis]MBK1875508.1 cellulase family glycosylhydrolase [Pelagicoccus mobilis]